VKERCRSMYVVGVIGRLYDTISIDDRINGTARCCQVCGLFVCSSTQRTGCERCQV